MNIKQVAEWLMEAGITYELLAIKGDQSEINQRRSAQFKDRAAQVEAMTCDGCRYWLVTIHPDFGCGVYPMGSECEKISIKGAGEKFGCIHWEAK